MTQPISVDAALTLVLARTSRLPVEEVSLGTAAGRVLAEAPRAVVDLPPFPSSAMDGFAVRAADTPGTLRVVGRSAAGRPSRAALSRGEAIAVATGGVVPDGADAVVPIERVVEHDDSVEVGSDVAVGENVRRRGGDVVAGDEILPPGTTVAPAQVGALAAAGVASVVCARRPRVAILTTGTELRPPGSELAPGEIYESNGTMLAALLERAGAEVLRLPSVNDEADAHRSAIAAGLESDVLVTSGGVSVGRHDLVREVLVELGFQEVFWRVAMRPGKPIAFGVRDSTLVFGLPGNPVSALVGALLFVIPALHALQGMPDPAPEFVEGTLASAAHADGSRDDFARARTRRAPEGRVLELLDGQESHMIVRAAFADALVLLPRGAGLLPAGSSVRYLRLD